MSNPGPRKYNKKSNRILRTLAKEHLRLNPWSTTHDVMQAVKCGPRTVYTARDELRAEGIQVMSPGDKRGLMKPQPEIIDGVELAETLPQEQEKFEKVAAGQLQDVLNTQIDEDLDDITPAGMRRILARIIKNPAMPPQVRIAAIAQKQKLDYDTQDRDTLGPGNPLSRLDAIDRLSMLMKACGPDLVHDAITQAFNLGGNNAPQETVDTRQSVEIPQKIVNESGGSPTIQTTG